MIDIKLIRESPKFVKDNIKKKGQNDKLSLVDDAKKKDEDWRKLKYKADDLRGERNKISLEISKAKKAKDEKLAKELIKQAGKIPDEIKKIEEKSDKLQAEIKQVMMQIPNIIHESVPLGKSDKDNVEIKKYGKIKKFNFEVKSHVELGEKLGLLDFDTSAEISGKGFYYIKGELALLNMALINFARDFMIKKKFLMGFIQQKKLMQWHIKLMVRICI